MSVLVIVAVLWECTAPQPLSPPRHQGGHPPAPHAQHQQQGQLRAPIRRGEGRGPGAQVPLQDCRCISLIVYDLNFR